MACKVWMTAIAGVLVLLILGVVYANQPGGIPLQKPVRSSTFPLPGGATIGMVWIEPGTFVMGSPEDEPGRANDEGPQHEVTISRGFYMGKYEITQGQWESMMGTRPWAGEDNVREKPDHPAVYISWDDVQGCIAKLNEAEGAEAYRLPTEAEWEYVCRVRVRRRGGRLERTKASLASMRGSVANIFS